MKKDNTRDYATAAFKLYARMGKPEYEQLKNKYYQEALKTYQRVHTGGTGISKPTEANIIHAENILLDKMAELNDILAVERTLQQLRTEEKKAVDIVYFEQPDKEFEKKDVSMRVNKASLNIPACERSVFLMLKKARNIFAKERGLRI